MEESGSKDIMIFSKKIDMYDMRMDSKIVENKKVLFSNIERNKIK